MFWRHRVKTFFLEFRGKALAVVSVHAENLFRVHLLHELEQLALARVRAEIKLFYWQQDFLDSSAVLDFSLFHEHPAVGSLHLVARQENRGFASLV